MIALQKGFELYQYRITLTQKQQNPCRSYSYIDCKLEYIKPYLT